MKKLIFSVIILLATVFLLTSCHLTHEWSDWELYDSTYQDCEGRVYSRYCLECNQREYKKGKHEFDKASKLCDLCGVSKDLVIEVSADGTYATVTDYNSDHNTAVIPAFYNGIPVTTIGDRAFLTASR